MHGRWHRGLFFPLYIRNDLLFILPEQQIIVYASSFYLDIQIEATILCIMFIITRALHVLCSHGRTRGSGGGGWVARIFSSIASAAKLAQRGGGGGGGGKGGSDMASWATRKEFIINYTSTGICDHTLLLTNITDKQKKNKKKQKGCCPKIGCSCSNISWVLDLEVGGGGAGTPSPTTPPPLDLYKVYTNISEQ